LQNLIDSHAHLDMHDFDKDREAVLDRAARGGLSHIITVGIDLNSSLRALELSRNSPMVFSSVGVHPHNAEEYGPHDLDRLSQVASKPEVVAWGEIGLDFYRDYAAHAAQEGLFEKQLHMAHELNLPVIIHDREAHDGVYAALKKMGKGERKGVIHCFSGDLDLAAAFTELGYLISIPGTVTYKGAKQVRDVAARLSLDTMLVETDCPFLAPVPKRGRRNEPLFVTFTAQEIARLRHTHVDEIAAKTSENAKRLFLLP